MRTRIIISGVLIGIIYIFSYGCRKAGLFLVKKDDPVRADALIILMGSIPDRVLQAADLLKRNMAGKVLIVEGSNKAFKELERRGVKVVCGVTQVRNALIDLGVQSDKIIIINGNAQSTHHEALFVRDFLAKNPGTDTLVLVSSAHHMRRAYIIFQNSLRTSEYPVSIICSPSSYTEFNAESWWKCKDDIETVLLEYLKLLNFILIEKWSGAKVVDRKN